MIWAMVTASLLFNGVNLPSIDLITTMESPMTVNALTLASLAKRMPCKSAYAETLLFEA